MYSRYNAENKPVNVHLPLEEHDYGYSKREAAYLFLADSLSLDLKKVPYKERFLEDFVTLLDSEELHIFNQDNPRPMNAQMGHQAMMDDLSIYEN